MSIAAHSRLRPRAPLLLLAGLQIGAGVLMLYATVRHADAYPSVLQWRFDLGCAALLCLTGTGLLRGRAWARRLSIMMVYAAFAGVLAWLYTGFDTHAGHWGYWLALALLPLLGATRQALGPPAPVDRAK